MCKGATELMWYVSRKAATGVEGYMGRQRDGKEKKSQQNDFCLKMPE